MPTARNLHFINVAHDNDVEQASISVRRIEGGDSGRPGIFWINGFMSVMAATKVSAVSKWAQENERNLVKFDFGGHGESGGTMMDGTIGRWLKEAHTVFSEFASGPQIIVGSSMGGWIALLLNKLIAEQTVRQASVHGIVLIAPAVDMSERLMWQKFPETVRDEILQRGYYERPSAYDDGPYLITRRLIEEGRDHLLFDAPLATNCPVRILHGMRDPDVPWQLSLELVAHLGDSDVVLQLIKDGDHRLSRDQDIDLLIATIDRLG
ncbi:MAG: alpha/beta hydrolase [Rhizobiales bacterium]|nr:alpha/beta hydrolase [Hyphomicrobiales bacterium]